MQQVFLLTTGIEEKSVPTLLGLEKMAIKHQCRHDITANFWIFQCPIKHLILDPYQTAAPDLLKIAITPRISVNKLQQTDRSTGCVHCPVLIVDLGGCPVSIGRERCRACNPFISRPVDSPQIAGEVESQLGCTLRDNTAVRNRVFKGHCLTRIDKRELEARGRLMLREEPAFGFDDEGL